MKRAVLVLVAALALTAPLAYATSLRDRDDVTTKFDISKTSGAHNRASDELVHTVDFYEAIPHRVPKSGPPDSVCVEIWTRSVPKESPADYEACATPAKGDAWKGSIARKRDRGPRLRVGAVKVQQPSDTRLVLRIDPDDVKRPASYRWRTESTSFGSDCKSTVGCPDYAPDRPETAVTKLSTPR
ncbi:MAG TPA: hypothetical protein VF066_13600 [Thermoleophilaceae bacterium]